MKILQGATYTLEIDLRPIWVVVTSISEQLPAGLRMNANFANTCEMFFERGCQAFTTDEMIQEIADKTVADIAAGSQALVTLYLLFQ